MCSQIFLSGRQALTTHVRRFRRKSYSRFLPPIAQTLIFRVQSLVHPMNFHRNLRYRPPLRVVKCLHDLKPALHPQRFDRARSHLIRLAPTQIKQLAIKGESVNSRLHHPLSDQGRSKGPGMMKTSIPNTAPRNFARRDVYLVCRMGMFWMSCVQI